MILYLNCDDNQTTYNKKNYLMLAAKRLGVDNIKDLRDRTDDQSNDYCLNIEPCSVKLANKWTGIWEIDLLCDRPKTGDGWSSAQNVFLAGYAIANKLEGLRHKTQLMFQACDPELHKRTKKAEYDFVQCGSGGDGLYAERTRLIEILRKKYTFMDYGKDKKPQEYVDNVSRAKVQFIRSMKSPIAEGEVAQRFFEGLAIGPVITNYVKDLEYLGLQEGVDYYSYRSDYELMEKFEYLISHDEAREKMALCGRQKALMYHTYEHRIISILNSINENKNKSV